MPTNSEFVTKLIEILQSAQNQRLPYLDVISGELHRKIGGYPGKNHRMPICCQVMKKTMKYGDQIFKEPPKGVGATLKVRYILPRYNLQ